MRNKITFFLAFFLMSYLNIFSQEAPPQGINYQAVIYNDNGFQNPGIDLNGLPLINTNIQVRFTIIGGTINGSEIYKETHLTKTDEYGLINLTIGFGTKISTLNFDEINWGSGSHFLKVELDKNGGTNFVNMGTQQFMSVPYALYCDVANSAGNGINTITGNPDGSLTFNLVNGSGVTSPIISGSGSDQQTLSIVGNTLSISNGNTITLPSSSGGGTLNDAYNFGGAGLGRTIEANSGSVLINNIGTIGLEVNSTNSNSTGILSNVSSTGVGVRVESTNASNTFAAIQSNTNSNSANNSAILGNNSGGGYGVSGQIPATATGTAAVFGNNLRTAGGSGVSGIGFNGIVGTATNGTGFGVYGINNGLAGDRIGTYGLGFHGVYGQTTDVNNGWAGYFTADLGVDGTGYSMGGWLNVSDNRLKTNIKPIQNALSDIKKIQGFHYELNTKSKAIDGSIVTKTRNQYGVLAQDLERIFPEMVQEKNVFSNVGDDTLYKTVDYIQLAPILIEAVKELSLEIELLKAEIEKIKSEKK